MSEERTQERLGKKNIIYAVIGVMTLVVAIVGATFAYYTATATNNVLTGNMATISFDIKVDKKTTVDETKGGLIPMTNAMIEKAVSNASVGTKGICVDDNGNAVCQIYKITVINSSTASMFVDGYISLTGGSGEPTDYPTSPTTMRWAQVFCSESGGALNSCTTAGTSTARQTETSGFTWNALGSTTTAGHDTAEILDTFAGVTGGNEASKGTIQGNKYSLIKTNYIRVSKNSDAVYTQSDDVTSALVYNQYLEANDSVAANNEGGDSYDSNTATTGNQTYVDTQVLYFVVWLSETGFNQTAGSGGTDVPSSTENFFQGTVTFVSAQGSEVTSRFSGWTAVAPDTVS